MDRWIFSHAGIIPAIQTIAVNSCCLGYHMAVFHKYILSLALMAVFIGRLSAQQHSYAHYEVRDGLAGSTVYCMAQDKEGFIWFGTETGLSRYDGTHFRNFTIQDGLPDNEILKIFVDSRNRVWFIPFKNTIAYYWKGKFHTHDNDSSLRKIPDSSEMAQVVEDPAGNILVTSRKGADMIDSSGHVTHITSPMPFPYMSYTTSGIDRYGRLCVLYGLSDNYEIGYVEGDKVVSIKKVNANEMNSPAQDYLGPDLQIWQVPDSTSFYDPVHNTQFRLRRPKGLISVSRINTDSVTMNTTTHSYLVDIRQRKVTDSFLQDESVSSAIQDAEGNIWFSTLGKGVYRMGSGYVKNYAFRIGNSKVGIYSIERFHDSLYIGADNHGLFSMNLQTGALKGPRIYGNLTRGRITHILAMDGQPVILGTDIGVIRLEKNLHFDYLESVKSLQLTADSELLTAGHVYVRERALSDLHVLDTIWMGRSTCAFKASDGAYYIGTLKGVYSVRKGMHPTFLGARWPLLTSRINVIRQAPDGVLWMATNGNGLIGYKDDSILYHVTEADGLTSNLCRTLLLKDGNIWAGTDKGLSKLTQHDRFWTVIPYTISDGLASDIINTVYVQGNEVYVGTPEGLTFFDERNISKTSVCILQMTDIAVSNHRWPQDTTGFVLPHKDNNISFSYVGISFKSAGNIVYSYRLLGLDTTWRTTRETFISYPSLPSGNYELQLTASNKFGVHSRMASVKFTIEKLLWEKTWFWTLVLLSVALCLYLLFRYRLRLIRRKEAEKANTATRMAELEQMALRSQMNPHFIFNCLNSIQQYVIYRDVPGANEFISQFSHLIRTTLKISTCELISLEEEVDYIRTYISLEKKRFDNKFNYEIVVAPEVDVKECHIPPMILQPYIENAVRHGIGLRKDNKGMLEVRMEYREKYLACIIEDSGVGRKVAAQFKSLNAILYQSMGMSLVRRRVEMYNMTNKRPAQIYIEDLVDIEGVGKGTKVSILFPLEVVLQK